jgi:DNA-directed RNA polymerase subunit RPC12/RpoP
MIVRCVTAMNVSASLITVESFTSPWDAYVVKGLLESEGIPTSLVGEHLVWANWPLSQALGGVQLQVPAAHVEHAREVLAELRRGNYEAALESELKLEPATCSKCGSRDLLTIRSKGSIFLNLVTLFLANAPFPPKIAGLKCARCGTMVQTLQQDVSVE